MGTTLFWLSQMGRIPKESHALFIGDYVAAKLGKGAFVVHSTHACGSGLFNVQKNNWEREAIDSLGIPFSCFPTVVSTGEQIGTYNRKGYSIPLFVSIGDLQASILGSFVTEKKDLSINIGTGSQISYISRTFSPGNYDIRSYFDQTFLYTITFLPAGRALNVIIRFVEYIGEKIYDKTERNVWERLNDLIKKQSGAHGLTARISFFPGNATGFATGVWEHVNEQNWTIENMFFAALENMSQNYFDAFLRFNKPLRVFQRIIVSGGLIKKIPSLQKLIEQKFKKRITLAAQEEETILGLLIYAYVCSRMFVTIQKASEHCAHKKIRFIKN
jgi:sugar (pentulose or hexulose) kinase